MSPSLIWFSSTSRRESVLPSGIVWSTGPIVAAAADGPAVTGRTDADAEREREGAAHESARAEMERVGVMFRAFQGRPRVCLAGRVAGDYIGLEGSAT